MDALQQRRPRPRSYATNTYDHMYQVPRLDHEELFKNQGVPGLMAAPYFSVAWHQYQRSLLDRLEQRVASKPPRLPPPSAPKPYI